jgi:hypothetical protein
MHAKGRQQISYAQMIEMFATGYLSTVEAVTDVHRGAP